MKQLFCTMLKRLWHELYLKTSPPWAQLSGAFIIPHTWLEKGQHSWKSHVRTCDHGWLIDNTQQSLSLQFGITSGTWFKPAGLPWAFQRQTCGTCGDDNVLIEPEFIGPYCVVNVWTWFLWYRPFIWMRSVCLFFFWQKHFFSGILTLPAAWFIWKEIGFD